MAAKPKVGRHLSPPTRSASRGTMAYLVRDEIVMIVSEDACGFGMESWLT